MARTPKSTPITPGIYSEGGSDGAQRRKEVARLPLAPKSAFGIARVSLKAISLLEDDHLHIVGLGTVRLAFGEALSEATLASLQAAMGDGDPAAPATREDLLGLLCDMEAAAIHAAIDHSNLTIERPLDAIEALHLLGLAIEKFKALNKRDKEFANRILANIDNGLLRRTLNARDSVDIAILKGPDFLPGSGYHTKKDGVSRFYSATGLQTGRNGQTGPQE